MDKQMAYVESEKQWGTWLLFAYLKINRSHGEVYSNSGCLPCDKHAYTTAPVYPQVGYKMIELS